MIIKRNPDKQGILLQEKQIADAMKGYYDYVEIKLSYDMALDAMAEMWEIIRDDGVNVAAEIQRRKIEKREKRHKRPDGGTEDTLVRGASARPRRRGAAQARVGAG